MGMEIYANQDDKITLNLIKKPYSFNVIFTRLMCVFRQIVFYFLKKNLNLFVHSQY